MTNADSATNMLWLINQATAGDLSLSGGGAKTQPAAQAADKKDGGGEEKKEGVLSAAGGASFNNFKIDMNA
jgi:hypothetical protein